MAIPPPMTWYWCWQMGKRAIRRLKKIHLLISNFKMLQTVLTTLAKAIAKDGEGATKLIEAETKGLPTDLAARMISKTIVGSPLVKTAIYGKRPQLGPDPLCNWV